MSDSLKRGFPIFFDPSITVAELKDTLGSIGIHLYGTPDGWVAERPPIFHLTKKEPT